MIKKLLFFFILVASNLIGQPKLYIPISINSPLFKSDTIKELQIGTKLSNYGSIVYFANQNTNRTVMLISIQLNNGDLKFDPLNFNKYYEQGQENYSIESYPKKHLYLEYALGKNYHYNSQKICFLVGFGQQFIQQNTRLFTQFDWGNESKVINTGVTLRANITNVNSRIRTILEPMIQGKLKLGKLRVTHQFGYSIEPEIYKVLIPIAYNKLRTRYRININCMKPTISFGIEYVL